MEEKLTFEQVLRYTIATLGNIKVPVAFKQDISDPISTAINNLEMLVRVIEDQKNKQEEVSEDGADSTEEPVVS